MKTGAPASIRIALNATPAQRARLVALQARFAEACNSLAPLVAQTRCWNRVALHHMAYKQLRERFPDLGSQMACNTIYSVSRIARIVYQHPESPFNLARVGAGALPQLQFTRNAPVYFDRHTLSLKDGQISMFTLDGRMRFELNLGPAQERRFREEKLREIVLTGRDDLRVANAATAATAANAGNAGNPGYAGYALRFEFAPPEGEDPRDPRDPRVPAASGGPAEAQPAAAATAARRTDWPEYVLVTTQQSEPARPLPDWLSSPTPTHPPRPDPRPASAP